MPDIDKLYEKAEKYLQKQKFESAFETFLEIHRYEPNDEQVLLNLGDLSLKLNRSADALRYASLLVDHYIKRNDAAKAVAACRKILKSFPQDVNTLMKLGGLFEKSQQNAEALKTYREALGLQRAAGTTPQAVDCLQRIIKLDPENPDAHLELAELASRAHQLKIATPEFLHAAELARKSGQDDRWAELVERAHTLDPADEAASMAAAELYLERQRPKEALALLDPLARSKPDDLTILELVVKAKLDAGDTTAAEPLCWKLYQARPETVGLMASLSRRLVEAGQTQKALELIGRVKDPFFQQGKRNEFLKLVEEIYAADESNLQVLEMLTSLYNELNKEDGLRRCLARLFKIYIAAEDYAKAAETMERILDVDPYGQGHYDRLLNLEGHIDAVLYKNILSRVEPPSGGRKAAEGAADSASATSEEDPTLEDLMIEGEMYLHYQLASKLKDTVEKIIRLYPGAEANTPRVRELLDASGIAPTAAPAISAAAPAAGAPAAEAPAAPSGPSTQSLEELKKIAEITARVYRESTPQGVLQVAANEIGRALNASRCWGALGAPGRPAALITEYCSPATPTSDVHAALKVYVALMAQAGRSPDGWSVEDVARFPVMAPIVADIRKLGIRSVLGMPLIDQEDPAGLLLAEQCERARAWTPGEALFVNSIASQVVIAINNTKLRRMVRALSGADEATGLLPRSSYLDCLLAEANRAKELSQPLSVCLFEPENPTVLVKTLGDAGVQRYIQQVSKAVQSHLRQNDVAIRYSPCAIAVVFPDTPLPQGGLAVEKLRRLIAQLKVDGAEPPNFCGVVCDVPLGPGFDAVDGVTELINRLEATLARAHKEGGKRVLVSKFQS